MSEFIHRFIPSPIGATHAILALHGTGGDENQLVELAQAVDESAAILSPRGNSRDEGVNRFFRRFAEGKFDMDDVAFRANELADWIEAKRAEHGLTDVTALGYSNGANIATSVLCLRPDALNTVIAIRGMTAYADSIVNLKGKRVLLINGETDPIVPHKDALGLAETLAKAGAEITHEWLPVGHELTRADVMLSRNWLAESRD